MNSMRISVIYAKKYYTKNTYNAPYYGSFFYCPMYTISLTFLSEILFPFVVGLFTTSPINHIVDEPPPSRLYAH